MRQAVIEVGSNGVRYELVEFSDDRWSSIDRNTERQDIAGGLLAEKAEVRRLMNGVAERVEALLRKAKRDGANNCFVFGTEACRRMEGVIPGFWTAAGVDLRILTQREEGYYGFLAASRLLGNGDRMVNGLAALDVGNGSTEITLGPIGASMDDVVSTSLPLGALAIERAFRKSKGSLTDLLDILRRGNTGRDVPIDLHNSTVVIMGGLITKIVWISVRDNEMEPYNARALHGRKFEGGDIAKVRKEVLQRIKQKGFEQAKLFVDRREAEDWKIFQILSGSLYFEGLMDILGFKEFWVSGESVRHGVIEEMYRRWSS